MVRRADTIALTVRSEREGRRLCKPLLRFPLFIAGWFLWREKLSTLHHSHLKDLSRTMATMAADEVATVLADVWQLALHYGGLLFASKEHIWGAVVGHLNVLYAIRMPNKGCQFLVGDPEIRQFKWLSFGDVRDMIINPNVDFDFFDV